MYSIDDATKIALENIPNGKIQAHIDYHGLYVFQIFQDSPSEGTFDPFYSVSQETGEFRDFSIITDGNTAEITSLFLAAKGDRNGR